MFCHLRKQTRHCTPIVRKIKGNRGLENRSHRARQTSGRSSPSYRFSHFRAGQHTGYRNRWDHSVPEKMGRAGAVAFKDTQSVTAAPVCHCGFNCTHKPFSPWWYTIRTRFKRASRRRTPNALPRAGDKWEWGTRARFIARSGGWGTTVPFG